MPEWKQTLDFSPWYHDEEISIPEKGKLVAKTICRVIKDYEEDYTLSEIIDMLNYCNGVPEEGYTEVQDFADRMADLYDWADSNRVWIVTY